MNPTPLPRGAWGTLATAWGTYALMYLGRLNLAIALVAIAADAHLGAGALGVVGTALYWSYAAGQLVNGRLGERVAARWFVAAGLVVSAVANLATGYLVPTLALLVGIWALNGWAQSMGWGPIVGLLARWFPPEERGRLTVILAPVATVGHALAWTVGGWLVADHGWRTAFRTPGLVLLLLAAAWILLIRDRPSHAPDAAPPPAIPTERSGPGIASILLGPRLRWTVLACVLGGMLKDSATLWTPTLLQTRGDLSTAVAAAASLAVPLGGIAGGVLAGALAARPSAVSEARTGALLAGLALLGALGLGLGGSLLPVAGIVLLLGVVSAGSNGVIALLTTTVPLGLGATGRASSAAGALDFLSYLGGGAGALAAGWLQETTGWGGVFTAWAVAAACLSLTGLWGTRAARATRAQALTAE